MADQVYKIPVTNIPQRFEITLSGTDYIFENRYMSGLSMWVFSLIDATTLETLILNMPMVSGANLLRQFAYLLIPGSLITFTIDEPNTPPALATLGDGAFLYYIIEAE